MRNSSQKSRANIDKQIMIYREMRGREGDAGDAIPAFLKKSLAKNFLAGL